MSDRDEEWGPWIKHDGTRIPLANGVFCQVVCMNGKRMTDTVVNPIPCGQVSLFIWKDVIRLNGIGFSGPGLCIVKYRIRKPKALEQLRQIARDVETPLVNTPKEPVRA